MTRTHELKNEPYIWTLWPPWTACVSWNVPARLILHKSGRLPKISWRYASLSSLKTLHLVLEARTRIKWMQSRLHDNNTLKWQHIIKQTLNSCPPPWSAGAFKEINKSGFLHKDSGGVFKEWSSKCLLMFHKARFNKALRSSAAAMFLRKKIENALYSSSQSHMSRTSCTGSLFVFRTSPGTFSAWASLSSGSGRSCFP